MVAINSPSNSLLNILCIFAALQGVLGQDKPSCLGYSKGDFMGDVITKDVCETACEVAEGLPIPDFKVAECNVTTALNETELAVDYSCSCVRRDSSNSNEVERRSLCADPLCASGGTMMVSSASQWIVIVGVVAWFLV